MKRTIRLQSTTKESVIQTVNKREAWNKGKIVGQKPPLKPKDIWVIRIHLQNAHAVRDLTMFNLAIDSKLRGCDLVSLRVRNVMHGTGYSPGNRDPEENPATCGRRVKTVRPLSGIMSNEY